MAERCNEHLTAATGDFFHHLRQGKAYHHGLRSLQQSTLFFNACFFGASMLRGFLFVYIVCVFVWYSNAFSWIISPRVVTFVVPCGLFYFVWLAGAQRSAATQFF
jgi:hypothetical protein